MRVRLLLLISATVLAVLMIGDLASPRHSVSAQINSITTLADIAGTGTATAISGTASARWVQIVALTTNVSSVRWGDSNITTSRGGIIAPGGGQYLPPLPPSGGQAAAQYRYNLATIYYLVQTGDTVSITWGN